MPNTEHPDLITDIDETMHTLAELTGSSADTVWLKFVRWYVQDLQQAERRVTALPEELDARVRLAAKLTDTSPEDVWHATYASAIVPCFR